jgi:hypothetical protein
VDDSTNLNGAVTEGIDTLESQLQVVTSVPFKDASLVLMTDGTDEAARVTQQTAQAKVDATHVHVFTVGLGSSVDTQVLKDFGKDGYEPAADASGLKAAFTQIADHVIGLADRFYLLEYCSPKRSGLHKLSIDATWTNASNKKLTGSLSTTFNADGFSSGCEL